MDLATGIDPQFYKSVAGIALAAVFFVNVLKRMIGNVPYLERVPTWVYSVAVAWALTIAASYFGVLTAADDTMLDRLITGAIAAATASGFFSWYNNPKDAIGDSTPAINQARKLGVAFLAVTLATSACAATTQSARHNAVVADTLVAESLFAIQDTEEALFSAGVVNTTQHKEFNARLLPLLEAGQKFNRAIRAWDPSQPLPEEVRAMIPQLKALLDHAVKSLTSDEAARGKILEKIALAQAAILTALSFLPQTPDVLQLTQPLHEDLQRSLHFNYADFVSAFPGA